LGEIEGLPIPDDEAGRFEKRRLRDPVVGEQIIDDAGAIARDVERAEPGGPEEVEADMGRADPVVRSEAYIGRDQFERPAASKAKSQDRCLRNIDRRAWVSDEMRQSGGQARAARRSRRKLDRLVRSVERVARRLAIR